jgi:putative hemolysin
MTPRHEVAWIDVGSDAEAIRQHLGRYPYSRFLVCEGNIDKVLGMIHTRDLLFHTIGGEAPNLRASLTDCLVVPETLPALRLLEQFRQGGIHLAVIVDEYGGTEGIVTFTDLLEGLVGHLNEIGEGEAAQATQREDGSWLLDGRLVIDDLDETLGITVEPSRGYRTLGGFVMANLKRMPKAADSFEQYGWTFEVVDMDGNRVDKVLATMTKP